MLEGGYDLAALGSSVVACLDVLRLTTQRDPRVDSAADQGYNGGSPDSVWGGQDHG